MSIARWFRSRDGAMCRGQPLFESLFVFENYPLQQAAQEQVDRPQLTIGDSRGVEQTNYSLTLAVMPSPITLEIGISYDRRRFDEAVIARMLGHFQTLLAGIAMDPERRLADLPLLTAAERLQLAGWNATWRDYPRDRCIHHLVE